MMLLKNWTKDKGRDIASAFSKHSPYIKLDHGVTRLHSGTIPKKVNRLSTFI